VTDAAYKGHLEVVKWALENGCPCDVWGCSSAAQGGHLDVLQWMRENRCPWDALTAARAARGATLMLRWKSTFG